MSDRRTEVYKFGGTSMGGAERIQRAVELCCRAFVQGPTELRLVVVASAMAGVTNSLVEAAQIAAQRRHDEAMAIVSDVALRHEAVLAELAVDDAGEVAAELGRIMAELREIVGAVSRLGELTARSRDRVLADGEKLSVRLLAAALRKAGRRAVALDADEFLETDGSFGEANPLGGVADRRISAAIVPVLESGAIAVVTGFCGRAPDGATTTLGRGGSDYTATLVAAALDAAEVTLWTDVDGVKTADPRLVPQARVIRQLNYREAAEMSFYGAKVLHQRTMIPVASQRIPVVTKNSFTPDLPGTRVDGHYTPGSHPVKAVSAVGGQCLVSVEGKGMSGVPGVAAKVFSALAGQGISVTMISQSSSESSICLAVPWSQAERAEQALKSTLQFELATSAIEEVLVRPEVGLVAAVGLGMAHTPGIAARTLGALGRQGINVLAIAQGSSELNITVAVDSDDVGPAVRAMHEAFDLDRIDTGVDSPDGFDVLLLGPGKVGRALLRLLVERRHHLAERFGLEMRVVAVADRSGFVLSPAGLRDDELATLSERKAAGASVAEQGGKPGTAIDMVEAASAYRLRRPVLVDCSDAEASFAAFVRGLELGCDVVSANKKPLAGRSADYQRLMETARAAGRVVRAEATVGAGLPVVDTLEILVATGDVLESAAGCLSGTLGFVMSRLEQGDVFSDVVRQAVELGYTEPDPVADLCGADVGRKAVILGRISGLADAVELRLSGLVPNELAGMPLEELFEKLRELDEPMRRRVTAAREQGSVLRYVAEVSRGAMTVGPRAVPADSALGGLQGTDNMVVFHSERYRDRPLVVSGPGAGIDVTAMGVLGDIFRVAAERRSS